MLDAYFRMQGYDVLIANWGQDGIEGAIRNRPDIIILDIRLPDIDGYEVAKCLRIDRRTKHIPIIFLTEKRSCTDKLRGLELVAVDYITKPFDIQELRLRVRNFLHRLVLGTYSNPFTRLLEGSVVNQGLFDCLDDDNWALISLKS